MASFGDNLRRERELRGIELRDIANATNISIRFLQALEQDRVDVLPGGIFRRSFVRQYARHVGLDPERVVAEFLFAHSDESLTEAEADPPPRTKPPRGALLVALFLAAGILLLLRNPSRRAHETQGPPPAPPASADVSRDKVYPAPAPTPREASAEAGNNLILTLSAQQACWVAAQVDGQTVLNRILNEGESETLEAAGEIILSVGNAGGVTFRVNDRPGVSLGRNGEVRRNIVISRKSLPSLVQEAPPAPGTHSS